MAGGLAFGCDGDAGGGGPTCLRSIPVMGAMAGMLEGDGWEASKGGRERKAEPPDPSFVDAG